MRALCLLALVAALIGSMVPARAGSLPPLMVFARLYTWRGHWIPVDYKEMVNSEALRIAVRASTPHGPATGISVRATLRHVSWQRSQRVIEPADVRVQLRQTMRRGHMARFQAILHVPATHPLQFSRVVIAGKQGAAAETVTSGVTFEPPMAPAEAARRLTVPQVFSFCTARPKLPNLSYGVAVRGYLRGVFTGSAGPAQFVVLAHRRTTTTNPTTLARRHEGFRAFGFMNLPENKLVTIVGGLGCRPEVGFGIVSPSR